MMTIALVLGGARCVYDDIAAAQKLVTTDIVVAVKDIGITWPTPHYWATLHPERVPKELAERRRSGLPDPIAIYTYNKRIPKGIDLPYHVVDLKGGSSGLLGVMVALEVADKAVVCGVPLDPRQPHYRRPKKQGWPPATMYRIAWKQVHSKLKDRVRSMSGWTRELLGEPTAEWVNGG